MMLKGIDISNWQKGIDPSKLDIDFCICKITEGETYVDAQFKSFYEKLKNTKIKIGFYHFARENDPVKEAEFFYSQCKSYLSKGIPVLDYEVWGKNTDVKWCERFITRFYELSKIYCMLYISASNCYKFKGSWIADKCALWVAGYPKPYTVWVDSKPPYNLQPWKQATIWQFTSSLNLKQWSGNLDGNIAYSNPWIVFDTTQSEKPTQTKPSASKSPFKGAGKYKCVVNSNSYVRIRNGAGTDQKIVGKYYKGNEVYLDDWSQNKNGYTWGRYIGATSGAYRYVALGTSDGRKVYLEKV